MLPFNLARTWHVQLSIFWTAASFLAAGIFLAPMIAGREPRRQRWLAYGLLGALAVVVFGSMAGEALTSTACWAEGLAPSASSGSTLTCRGSGRSCSRRAVPVVAIIYPRSPVPAADESAEHAVAVLLRRPRHPGVLRGRHAHQHRHHLTVADFWRFWVVHLWVEDFLEMFTTVLVAYIFVMLGVVRQRVAMTVIFLDIILYSAGGVIGTMHHLYFSGTPVEHMALGAFFSARR